MQAVLLLLLQSVLLVHHHQQQQYRIPLAAGWAQLGGGEPPPLSSPLPSSFRCALPGIASTTPPRVAPPHAPQTLASGALHGWGLGDLAKGHREGVERGGSLVQSGNFRSQS